MLRWMIELMFTGFRREDLIPVPEIAVPVSVPQQCTLVELSSATTPKDTAIGDLALIYIFYMLRVGEYTQRWEKTNTCTIKLRLCDIVFKNGDVLITRDAPASEILAATAATLRLSNQHNGIRGSLIHCRTAGGKYSPVVALALLIPGISSP